MSCSDSTTVLPPSATTNFTVVREYHTAYNAVIEPDKYVACTQYFIRRWMPLLGGTGMQIVLALRSLGFYNPKTGEKRDGVEVDMETLAGIVGVDTATIKRQFGWRVVKGKQVVGALANPALHVFVQREKQYYNDRVTGKILRAKNIYRVKMDDPLHEEDLPKLQEALDTQEKNTRTAQNAPYGKPAQARRRAQNAPNRAQNVDSTAQNAPPMAQNALRAAQNARPLIDYSYLPETTLTTTDHAPRALPDIVSLTLLEQEKKRRNLPHLTRQHLRELCQQHGWATVSAELRAVMDTGTAQGKDNTTRQQIYRELEAEWRGNGGGA